MSRRRVHVSHVQPGRLTLPLAEAHHLRDVLRLTVGDEVELFDPAGATGIGRLTAVTAAGVITEVGPVTVAARPHTCLTVAAAVPKGDRADWMVEKLSELGVDRFVPIVAARSVVVPAGRGKLDRWERIAAESAKQSRRAGTMSVAAVTPLADVIRDEPPGWVLSTDGDTRPIASVAVQPSVVALVGPEGGWTNDELAAFATAGWLPVGLTRSVLRIETAAVAIAAIVGCAGPRSPILS